VNPRLGRSFNLVSAALLYLLYTNCLNIVQSLIAQGFVDPNAIAISGHSWGGYQTAYLVTRTSMFKAAESGAPVANMTRSASCVAPSS